MNTYYRFTNKDNPMSDWGHAMFANRRWKVENYGRNEYTIDDSKTVAIWDIRELIINTWNNCKDNYNFGQLQETEYYITIDADKIYESFNPVDIVDSAEGYDCDWVCWLWVFVLEPNNILAVHTRDGAVCFDETLINKVIARAA